MQKLLDTLKKFFSLSFFKRHNTYLFYFLNHLKSRYVFCILTVYCLCINLNAEKDVLSLRDIQSYNKYSFGVYIYNKTLDSYKNNISKLVEKCYEIGLTEVYLSFSKRRYQNERNQYTKTLSAVIKLFHTKNIKVFALTLDNPTLIFNKKKISSQINDILEYNSLTSYKCKFDGISADLEPHMLKKKNYLKKDLPVYWDSLKDQKNLIKLTLEALKFTHNKTGKIPLSEAIPWFYIKRFQSSKSKYTRKFSIIDQFLKSGCSYLVLMVYSNSIRKVIKNSLKALETTHINNSIMLCLKTSINTLGGEGAKTSFYNICRTDLIKNILSIITKAKNYKSFRGISFFEFEGLNEIWQTTKNSRIKH